jgi:hypothetical protein
VGFIDLGHHDMTVTVQEKLNLEAISKLQLAFKAPTQN